MYMFSAKLKFYNILIFKRKFKLLKQMLNVKIFLMKQI